MTPKDASLEDDPTIDIGGVLPELGVSRGGPVILAGRYLLLGLLGTGGMGTVYRARDLELEEEIAVKVLRRELVQNAAIVSRFRQEVKLARRVTHRNVARTFDIGEHGGDRFITMEYIEGESLADRLARRGKLPFGEALDLASSICSGLSAAHAAGVVHRDLKPENVLIDASGRVVLTDFGLALTFEDEEGDTVVDGSGDLVGTPVYMAPEQVEGKLDVDARADVYALGAMLFEIVTGERPWRGDTAWAVAAARLQSPPPDVRLVSPSVPESLAGIISRAMARSREDRFRDIDDLAAELSSVVLPSGPASQRGYRASLPSMPDLNADIGAKTVAVLPFAWAREEDVPFAYGFMLDLLDELWTVESLRVRGPISTLPLVGRDRDVRAIGRSLGVQAVVDGAVRREGGRVQVVARLTAVADGFQLWASRFERAEGDWNLVVSDVYRGITSALTVRERAPRAPAAPPSVETYVSARFLLATGPLDHESRTGRLEEAVRLAHGTADARLLTIGARAAVALEMDRAGASAGGWERAGEVAARALALDAGLADAHLLLARSRIAKASYPECARALREALRLQPGAPEMQALFGRTLALAGRPRQGLTFLEAALGLEPALPNSSQRAVMLHALLGDWSALERAIALPGRVDEAMARTALWHPDPGVAHAVRRATGATPDARAMASLAPTTPGGADFVRRRLARLGPETPADLRIEAHQEAAELFAVLGMDRAALQEIESAVGLGLSDITWLERCPPLAQLGTRFGVAAAEVSRRAEAVRLALRSGRS